MECRVGGGGREAQALRSRGGRCVLRHGLPSHDAAHAPAGCLPRTVAPKRNVADTYSSLIEASEEVLSKSHRKKKSRLEDK